MIEKKTTEELLYFEYPDNDEECFKLLAKEWVNVKSLLVKLKRITHKDELESLIEELERRGE